MDIRSEIHTIALDVNHVEICRFNSASDNNYKILEKHIKSLVNNDMGLANFSR